MNLSTVSFGVFVVLNAAVAWGTGLLLWRRIRHRASAVHAVAAVMLALSFALGALWFNLVHVRTFEPLPADTPRGDTGALGLVVLGGVAGIILLVLATILALAGYALWDQLPRRRPDSTQNAPGDSG